MSDLLEKKPAVKTEPPRGPWFNWWMALDELYAPMHGDIHMGQKFRDFKPYPTKDVAESAAAEHLAYYLNFYHGVPTREYLGAEQE